MSNDGTSEYKTCSQAEAAILEFLLSGEPETTQKYQLKEYNGPLKISRSRLPGAGRGLFPKEPVNAGQIVLISMAEASCIRYFSMTNMKRCSAQGPSNSIGEASTSYEQLGPSNEERVCREVHDQLTLGLLASMQSRQKFEQIFNLDHYYCDPKSLESDVDFFKGQGDVGNKGPGAAVAICKCPTTNRDEVIRSIVAKNASYDDVKWCVRGEPDNAQTCEFWGVWILPSLMNHSCAPNCTRTRVGEALIIRAATDLAAEEELTLPYFDVFKQLQIRERSARLWHFKCECPRCLLERSLHDMLCDIEEEITFLNEKLKDLWHSESTGAHEKEVDASVLLSDMRSLSIDIDDIALAAAKEEEAMPGGFLGADHERGSSLSKRLDKLRSTKKAKIQKMREGRNRDQLKMKGKVGESSHSLRDMENPVQSLRSESNRDSENNLMLMMSMEVEAMTTRITQNTQAYFLGKETVRRWIRASFLDAYIAGHSLASIYGAWHATHNSITATGWMVVEIEHLTEILRTIVSTDPGSLVGEQYCCYLWRRTRQFLSDKNPPKRWTEIVMDFWPTHQELIKIVATAIHGNHKYNLLRMVQ